MDVSDGLAGDLAKLCRASGAAAEIDVARVPLSDAARAALTADPALIEPILTGGDDYEIVLTLSPDRLPAFRAAAAATGIAVTEIGRVTAGQGARFMRDGNALSFARPSYSHF
jgi:thiamine-monophosphate kinase